MQDLRTKIAPLEDLSVREIHDLYKLRVDVFVGEQETPYYEIDDADIHPDTRHILILDGDELVGCGRVVGNVIGRIISRRPGVGSHVVRTAMSLIDAPTATLSAQSRLVGWYERFGFQACGPETLDTGVPHTPMEADLPGEKPGQ